jgi:hypothetical protein
MTPEERNYEITKVHKMETKTGHEDIYEVLKESQCLPVPSGMQCSYCKVNYFEGDASRIKRKMSPIWKYTFN